MRQPPAARPAPSRLRPAGRELIVARIGGSQLGARRRGLFCGIPFALILAACAPTTQGERAQFLGAPAMERTIARSGLRLADETSWPREEWWRAFRSPELDGIVDKALRDNQSLRKAEDALRGADALVQVAGARLLPEVQATFGMRQSRNPLHGVVASYNPAQGGLEKTMAFLNPLALTYELDFWRKNRALLDAAIGESAAQEAEFEQARLLLSASVARAYLRGYAAARQLEAARALTRMRRDLVSLAETRYRTGLDSLDGAQTARAEFENAVRREAAAEALLTLQKNALARLIGEGPDATRDLYVGRKAPAPAAPPLPRSLPIELLVHRPDLAAALRRAEAAAARVHVAKTLFLPSIDLATTGGFEGSVTSTKISKLAGYLFTPSAIGYAVSPTLRLPVFQGGRLSGILEAQHADYDQAVDSYNETLLQAAQQVADASTNFKRACVEYEAQSRNLRAARAQYDLAQARLRDGIKDRREIVAERVDLLESGFAQRALEGDRLIAAVDLYQALGGGYAGGPPPNAPKPAPETDPLTPAVEAIQSLGGG
ncbi:efflux transporter outer membrane subunit [Methylocystis sp.]|uniref:efflux transporter outer membrane subunit n=1 Tax=Methylocystis sp. TaxID=1911079 RepID=UPI0025D62040|nr:efflux transporter outer membrane subunit [Methylocystis sp.]